MHGAGEKGNSHEAHDDDLWLALGSFLALAPTAALARPHVVVNVRAPRAVGVRPQVPHGVVRQPVVRVRVAPPPVRVEVQPVRPSVRHVWAPGYWNWVGGRHVWVAGVWTLPRVTGQVWVAPSWVNLNGEWVLQAGHWA